MASEREKKIIAAACVHAARLAEVAVKTRVKAEAMTDFIRRGFEAFDQEPFTEEAAQTWVTSQQVYASHLFEPQGQQQPGTPAAPQPQSHSIDYNQIKDPAARLTKFRADEMAR